MTEESNHDCRQCGAIPGEVHRDVDDLTRCVITGAQLYMCESFSGHVGPCYPDVWDGEFPGTKECREYNMYTPVDSIWEGVEDLNTLMAHGKWNSYTQKHELSEDFLIDYRENYDKIFRRTK